MPGRMVQTNAAPAAMRHGDDRAATGSFELDLHFGPLRRRKVQRPPLKHDARRRTPFENTSGLDDTYFVTDIEGLDQTSADSRLEPQDSPMFAGNSILHSAPPPTVD